MRIFDYLLSMFNEISALLGGALMKILSPLAAIATAIKSIIDWRREKRRKRRPIDIYDDEYDDEPRDSGRHGHEGFWLFGRGLIVVLLFSVGAYAWWKSSQGLPSDNQNDSDSMSLPTTARTPEELIRNYFSYIGSGRYQEAWNLLDRNERLNSFPNGFDQFDLELRSRQGIQFHGVRLLKSSRLTSTLSVQLSYVNSAGTRKNCDDTTCIVTTQTNRNSFTLNRCDPPPNRACW